MPRPVSIPFSKVQHVGIPSRDVDASKQFYELLGFVEVMRKIFNHAEGLGTCIMMQKEDIVIEFYQLPASTVVREIITRSDGHIDHIAFDVTDIHQVYSQLHDAGFNPIQEAPVKLDFWERGVQFFHIVGPDGERLEFNEVL